MLSARSGLSSPNTVPFDGCGPRAPFGAKREALPSWAGIDAEEIEVSEVSGHGGSKTFKVAAPPDGGFEPPVVAAEHVDVEPLTEYETEGVEAMHPRVDASGIKDGAADAFLDDLDRLEARGGQAHVQEPKLEPERLWLTLPEGIAWVL